MGSITDRQVVYLAMVFNSIKNVTIEDYRMHSYLLPSPQTGKNDTRLQGYCKITMQNTFGKLLEQIIATKVSRHIKQYHRFPPGLRECKGRPGATREFWYSTCSNVFTHAKKPAWLECIKQTLCGIPNRSNLGTPIKSLPIYWIFSVLYASRVVVKCEIWTSNPKLSKLWPSTDHLYIPCRSTCTQPLEDQCGDSQRQSREGSVLSKAVCIKQQLPIRGWRLELHQWY